MKKYYALSLILVFTLSCTTFHRVKSNKLVTKAKLGKDHFYEELPLTLKFGIPRVLVQVGLEKKPYHFYFDTGGYTVLSKKAIAAAKGKKQKSYIDVKDSNNQTSRINTYLLDQLTIGAIPFEDVGFAEISFTEAVPFTCAGIDGTIGPNIMKECIWYFDVDQNKVILTDDLNRIAKIDQAIRVPIRTNNIQKPLIDFTINGHQEYLQFDTGDDGLLSIRGPLADELMKTHPFVTLSGQRIRAGHSEMTDDVMLIKSNNIQMEGLPLEDIIISSRKGGTGNSLGTGIFDLYNVVFNLGEDEVYFIKRENGSMKKEVRSFGFSLDYTDQKIIISGIYSDSPASKEGLQAGDELLKINGHTYQFPDYCSYMNEFDIKVEETMELELARKGKHFKVTLKKERLL